MFNKITSTENLFAAWSEFRQGKAKRKDVAEFELNLEDNIFKLQTDLTEGTYRHGSYMSFFVCDPKRRHIHKAEVRDRLLHHAVVRIIEPVFDRVFIYDSWSCRKNKGTHNGVKRFQQIAQRLSENNTKNLWVLKMDIRKFFDSINPLILADLLKKSIPDAKTFNLLQGIINSFSPGLPLGNLTSQLFANIYMNELDQFVKHHLRIKGYIRYADDFIFLDADREFLITLLPAIKDFLSKRLKLEIHPNKIVLRNYRSGIDFLGYVSFPTHRVIRTKTKRRIFTKITQKNFTSYSGQLSHCRSYNIRQALLNTLRDQRKATIAEKYKS
jgi:RNA-directed DNA polymerase